MIESTLIQRFVNDGERAGRVKSLVDVLVARWGTVPPTVTAGIEQVKEQEKLARLIGHAATCTSLEAFEQRLRQELSAPEPASTRGKRRSRKPPA